MNFGNQTVGTAATTTITLNNATGHKTRIVSVSSSVAQFSYSWPSLPFTLNPGQQLTGTVTFTPAALQIYNGTLTFTAANGPSIVVSLTGTGVQAQPLATIQPASEMVTAGQTATFSASVSGATPVGYQWKKNGAAINGATSAGYTTPPTTTSDNGAQFTVTVSTSTGSVSSNPATLTVNAARGGACDHHAACQPDGHCRSGSVILSSRDGYSSAQLSMDEERDINRRSNILKLHDSGYNHSRQRLTILLLPSAIRQVM